MTAVARTAIASDTPRGVDGAERDRDAYREAAMTERVVERANQHDGADGSLVHQVLAVGDTLDRATVHG